MRLPPIQEIANQNCQVTPLSTQDAHTQERVPAKSMLNTKEKGSLIQLPKYKEFTMNLDKASLEISSILNSASSHNKLL